MVEELFDPSRTDPVGVVTTRHGETEPLINATELAEQLQPLSDPGCSLTAGRWTVEFRYRKRVRLGSGSWLNLSGRGASVSRRAGRMTFNSRGGGSIRILPGLSFRFGRRR